MLCERSGSRDTPEKFCLNPCSVGICSVSGGIDDNIKNVECLNPCSVGICSVRRSRQASGLRTDVLILVLLEYALWEQDRFTNLEELTSLNPCSVGICSVSLFLLIGWNSVLWRADLRRMTGFFPKKCTFPCSLARSVTYKMCLNVANKDMI